MCSIADKILVALVKTFENPSLAVAKLAIFGENFQLQICSKLDFNSVIENFF